MEYTIIDKVSGDSLQPGDFLLVDNDIVELLGYDDEGDEFTVLNHTTGDDYFATFDPDSYFDLLEA